MKERLGRARYRRVRDEWRRARVRRMMERLRITREGRVRNGWRISREEIDGAIDESKREESEDE